MDEVRNRLVSCFLAVFPSLAKEDVIEATAKTTEAWDSVATVTLVATIEEEFGIEIDIQYLVDFGSFDGILDYLQKTTTSPKK
jgi:acyl carrier protein